MDHWQDYDNLQDTIASGALPLCPISDYIGYFLLRSEDGLQHAKHREHQDNLANRKTRTSREGERGVFLNGKGQKTQEFKRVFCCLCLGGVFTFPRELGRIRTFSLGLSCLGVGPSLYLQKNHKKILVEKKGKPKPPMWSLKTLDTLVNVIGIGFSWSTDSGLAKRLFWFCAFRCVLLWFCDVQFAKQVQRRQNMHQSLLYKAQAGYVISLLLWGGGFVFPALMKEEQNNTLLNPVPIACLFLLPFSPFGLWVLYVLFEKRLVQARERDLTLQREGGAGGEGGQQQGQEQGRQDVWHRMRTSFLVPRQKETLTSVDVDEQKEKETCSICLEVYSIKDLEQGDVEQICLPCSHRFHAPCLDTWFAQQPHPLVNNMQVFTCPLCRQDIPHHSLPSNTTL